MDTVALDSPPAQVLADQAGIIADLQFVMDCCKRLLAELAKADEERDGVVPLALWSAAVVSYARCFTHGKQFGLRTGDVRALPLQGEVLKFHHWVLGERQKIAAHPASPFDAARVGAALSDGSARRVEGIAIMSASRVLVDAVGVRQLGGLASELARRPPTGPANSRTSCWPRRSNSDRGTGPAAGAAGWPGRQRVRRRHRRGLELRACGLAGEGGIGWWLGVGLVPAADQGLLVHQRNEDRRPDRQPAPRHDALVQFGDDLAHFARAAQRVHFSASRADSLRRRSGVGSNSSVFTPSRRSQSISQA